MIRSHPLKLVEDWVIILYNFTVIEYESVEDWVVVGHVDDFRLSQLLMKLG